MNQKKIEKIFNNTCGKYSNFCIDWLTHSQLQQIIEQMLIDKNNNINKIKIRYTDGTSESIQDYGKKMNIKTINDKTNVKHKDTDVSAIIASVCDEIKTLLISKNKSYGNSVLEPVRIFSKAVTLEQINVRIDDKLSRIARGHEFDGDDTELDLIGYLILKRVLKKCMVLNT